MVRLSATEKDWLAAIGSGVFTPAVPPRGDRAAVAARLHALIETHPSPHPLEGAFFDDTDDPSTLALTLVYPVLARDECLIFMLDTVTHMHKHNLAPLLLERISIGDQVFHAGTFSIPTSLISTAGMIRTTAQQLASITGRSQWKQFFARAFPLHLLGTPQPQSATASVIDGSRRSIHPVPPPQPQQRGIFTSVPSRGLRGPVHLALYGSRRPDYLLLVSDGDRYRDSGLLQELGRLDARGFSAAALLFWPDQPEDRSQLLSRGEILAPFLEDAALPWAGQHTALPDARNRIIAGGSLGGLAAAELCGYFPHIARCATVQSASWWWNDLDPQTPEGIRLVRWKNSQLPTGIRLFVEVGSYEGYLLSWNRAFRDILRAQGTRHTYREYSGGHDYACWTRGLVDSLAFFADTRSFNRVRG